MDSHDSEEIINIHIDNQESSKISEQDNREVNRMEHRQSVKLLELLKRHNLGK